jgi:hypothetical protein
VSDTLLAEASALSERLFGADPLKQAELRERDFDFEVLPPAAEATEPDPDAALPYAVEPGRIEEFLTEKLPEVAHEAPAATSTLAALPRELVALMDGEGMFGSALSWQLLAQIGRNAVTAEGEDPVELDPDRLAVRARELGLPDDLETLDNVSRFLRSLPPKVRSGISPEMAADPDLWALAAHLGSKLWSFTLTRPRRH